ncbi:uncharacterized protein LOC113228275 [Hyposmocoma kahamanoa]|uniref:uncharacterized protein LOC113228275 n=1 Tax=Hyposmocoma kahamanoa TaxID=1477025 RepID=UPI000E6D940F|nr:uncharacterized protein LOC113228275 [Hyposmocoma kahamanoa]
MKLCTVLAIVLCIISVNFANALTSEERAEVTDSCCVHGEAYAVLGNQDCDGTEPPDSIEVNQTLVCIEVMKSCCQQYIKRKADCAHGMTFSSAKRCSSPDTDIGKNCCEECSLGRLTGESQGKFGCGGPPDNDMSTATTLRKNAFYKCCLEAANKPPVEVVTEKITCKPDSCEQTCNIENDKVTCSCHDGYRLSSDKKSCKDINECAESTDDLCTSDGTVCHNTPGSFKCVPIKKREVGFSCPPGYKPNVKNQVCDDIDECNLPYAPCPRRICENTIGGYKCNGKPGRPLTDDFVASTLRPPVTPSGIDMRIDICPPGFRAGPKDDCIDVDECEEHLDDCNRLSQYCINTHGSFFCQDHVSRRCKPGFSANFNTGICEDINECEENSEACGRGEECINWPGAYTCKKKTEAYPTNYRPGKANPNIEGNECREGTRKKLGGGCEDIDECVEGSHLCDRFQDCFNTNGGHECYCKSGFELDTSETCVDIDECALKLDDCSPNQYCINTLGSYICNSKKPPHTVLTTTTTTTTKKPIPVPSNDYVHFYPDEDNSSSMDETKPEITSATLRPTTLHPPRATTRRFVPKSTTRRLYTNKPTTTSSTRKPEPVIPEIRPGVVPIEVDAANKPKDPFVVEKEKDPEGSVAINTAEIPKDTWTNVIGIDRKPENRPENRQEDFKPTTRPDSRPNRPDNRFNSPDNRFNRPDGPYIRPHIPEYRPVTPGSRSERPDSKPNRPIYKPGRPNSKPETPGRQPESKHEKPNSTQDDNVGLNDLLHCINGYEKNEKGECVDIDECKTGRHICGELEVCINRQEGYICECKPGYKRNVTGAGCIKIQQTVTTSVRRTTTVAPIVSTAWSPYAPRNNLERPSNKFPPLSPNDCAMGYKFDSKQGRCVDIDECTTNRSTCSSSEECVNSAGGFHCVCGLRCRGTYSPAYPTFSTTPRDPTRAEPSIITVGSQIGQRGPRYLRPSNTRLPGSGAIVKNCPWGYKLTAEQMCYDIDECAKNVTECGPQQRCENFYGGYSCQCPPGHQLVGQNDCEDVNECSYGRPCPYNSKCVNIPGSYRCECESGFRNAPSNDKMCVDIDECSERPNVCEQGCANTWGSYRCFCQRGYRLHSDNGTCVDVDECAEWQSVRLRGRLCGGECINELGSYRCSCPSGYRLSEDGRNCIDIDECDMGTATCAHGPSGLVCQNTRGGYYCHRIECPSGYRLESKHICTRVQRSCQVGDWNCIQQPSTYSFNFITFVANAFLPHGSVDLFTMHGPAWTDSEVTFELRMLKVDAPDGVKPMDLSCFVMRPMNNICVVSLRCSPEGPQVGEMELVMSLHQLRRFAGSAVARLFVIVSQYEF